MSLRKIQILIVTKSGEHLRQYISTREMLHLVFKEAVLDFCSLVILNVHKNFF